MSFYLLPLLLAFQSPDERSPHPLAPSIPVLSKEEYQQIDAVIARFVKFDIGGLKGPEGKQALEELNRLGPEAIFNLIDGFNRAAQKELSCPVVYLGRKISIILSASNDVALLSFAKENIGAGVTTRRVMGTVEDLKITAQLRRTLVQRRMQLAGISGPVVTTRPVPMFQSVDALEKLVVKNKGQAKIALDELGRRTDPKVLDALARVAIADTDQAEPARVQMDSWLTRQPPAKLSSYLQDSRPPVRAAAIRLAAQKKLLSVGELVGLLKEDEGQVVQAARQALIQLSGGADYGPLPSASAADREQAVRDWQEWAKGQK